MGQKQSVSHSTRTKRKTKNLSSKFSNPIWYDPYYRGTYPDLSCEFRNFTASGNNNKHSGQLTLAEDDTRRRRYWDRGVWDSHPIWETEPFTKFGGKKITSYFWIPRGAVKSKSHRVVGTAVISDRKSGGMPAPPVNQELTGARHKKDRVLVVRKRHNRWSEKRSLQDKDETKLHQVDNQLGDADRSFVKRHGRSMGWVGGVRPSQLASGYYRTGFVPTTAVHGYSIWLNDKRSKSLDPTSLRRHRVDWEPEPDYDEDDPECYVFNDYGYPDQVKLREEFEPEKFLDEVPVDDKSGRPLPLWKRLLTARQLAERSQQEHDEKQKVNQEENKYKDMPVWKRSLLQKRHDGNSDVGTTTDSRKARHVCETSSSQGNG